MTLEIKKYPSAVLKKRAKPVKEITREIKNLCRNMMETIKKEEGAGLAANQVGVLERIIVIQTKDGPRAFINPEILKKTKEKNVSEEGCLSFPGLFLKIKRPVGVEIRAIKPEGEEIKFNALGLTARIFQHEIDHLNGILFFKRVSFWQRIKLRKILRETRTKKNN